MKFFKWILIIFVAATLTILSSCSDDPFDTIIGDGGLGFNSVQKQIISYEHCYKKNYKFLKEKNWDSDRATSAAMKRCK